MITVAGVVFSRGRSGLTDADLALVTTVGVRASGYVIDINLQALRVFARESGRSIQIEAKIGALIIAGQPLVSVDGESLGDADETALRMCCTLDRQRTLHQDPA